MKQLLAATIVSLFVLATASAAPANSKSPKPGEHIKNPSLAKLGGGKQKLVGKADINVIVFFKPDHEYSKVGLKQIARVEKELAGKSVSWVAVVSSRFAAADVKAAAKAAGIQMPILVDKNDKIYGDLGIALYPMVVTVDKKTAVAGYQPYRKVNFYDQVRARVRHGLGEIDDAQLAAAAKPAAANNSGASKEAMRQIKLGRMLLRSGKYVKALKSADSAIEKAPDLAAGYSLRGQVFAAQDNCKKAVESFDKALELDPSDSAATEGKAACEKSAAK